jgi:3-hydroxyisobutyrate dehydrogenase
MSVRLGFVGIGLMGLPMCRRLLGAGLALTVWNRNPEKCLPLVDEGAQHADSIAALVEASDIVMLCVADTAAVEAVVFAAGGVASAGDAGKILVDFSSIEPVATRLFAERLHLACGMHWVDAPVSGGVVGAEQGRLVVMAGGEPEVVEQIRPVLAPLALRVTRMGPVGSGQVSKICNQMIVATNALLIAETVALAEKAGVDASLLAPALAGGFADSLPFQILTPRMASRRFEPVQWRVKTLQKDLDNASRLAQELHANIPLAHNAGQLMRLHAEQGYAMADLSTLIALYAPE